MDTSYCYDVQGANALAPRSHGQLRLVYDRRRDLGQQVQSKASHQPAILIVALCFVILLVVGALSTFISNARYQARQDALSAMPTKLVTVMPGDSLWTLASRCNIKSIDTADVVTWLEHNNDLQACSLSVGQKLLVPQGQS